jgi:bifunctional non-homologous end joining protein LigD
VSGGGAPARDREPSGQLPLGLEQGPGRLAHRVRPMLPTEGEGPFDDPAYLFEPWWPGIRAFVSVEDGRVHVRAEALGDPAPCFPELAALPLLVRADGVVLDVTLMVLDADGRPSTRLLDARLAPESGVVAASRLAGTAAVVASDLVFRDGEDLSALPFRDRRASLDELIDPSAWCMPARGFVGEGTRVASVLGPLGFTAMSARRLDAHLRRGRAGDGWFRVPLVASPRALPPILALVRKLPL